MKIYADYEFYVTEYNPEGMTEPQFRKNIMEAAAYIKRLTLQRSENFTGEELKYAACAVAEAYFEFDKQNPGGKVVVSENNDGFSQSFANSGQTFEQARANRAYTEARKWLANTGLLSRRIKSAYKC